MEWIVGPGSNEVDIGYVPLMRAYSSQSVSWEPNLEMPISQEMFNISSITWDKEISLSTATQEIEKAMYPFKKVNIMYAINIRKSERLYDKHYLPYM